MVNHRVFNLWSTIPDKKSSTEYAQAFSSKITIPKLIMKGAEDIMSGKHGDV